MTEIFRFGISLPKELVDKFDQLIRERNYTNRSKAFGDLIRQELIKQEWQKGREIAGAIVIIYNHHKRELLNKINDLQHDYQKVIISTQHIHLDHHNCLEILAIKGNPKEAQQLTDKLKSLNGIKHANLSMSSTGQNIL